MDTQIAEKTLHQMIDQIEDDELLTLYIKLLEREIKKEATKRHPVQNIFNTTEAALIARAEASLQSVEKGRTRPIENFRQDIETWRIPRAT